MNKPLDDDMLYAHIPEAEEAMLCALTEEEHTFSKGFARKMRRLLRYERRGRFGRTAAQAGRAAAAVLAAVLALNLILVGTVEAYREQAWQLLRRVTRKYTEFRIETNPTAPTSPFVPIDPPYIPEGYEEVERVITDMVNQILYCKDDKNFFYSQTSLESGPLYIDTEDANVEVLSLYGCDVYVITENKMTHTYWVDADCAFSVSGNSGYEEILKITENILKSLEK